MSSPSKQAMRLFRYNLRQRRRHNQRAYVDRRDNPVKKMGPTRTQLRKVQTWEEQVEGVSNGK